MSSSKRVFTYVGGPKDGQKAFLCNPLAIELRTIHDQDLEEGYNIEHVYILNHKEQLLVYDTFAEIGTFNDEEDE